MKKMIVILSLLLLLIQPAPSLATGDDFGPLYIHIGEAIMDTKAGDLVGAKEEIEQFKVIWDQSTKTSSTEVKAVNQSLKAAQQALESKEPSAIRDKLSALSNALLSYDKMMHPIDPEAERKKFETALTPVMKSLEEVISTKDGEKINNVYKRLSTTWTKNEKIVREQSIDYYGQIETKMGFLRIAITKDEKDFTEIQRIYQELSQTMANFVSGKEVKKADKKDSSIHTLVDLLEKAVKEIDNGKSENATELLQEFLTVWPVVEGEVQTRNGGLYAELENNIPILAGKLSSKNNNIEDIKTQLKDYIQDISLIETKQYTVWDAALIMLREGLEALLIIAALIAFLKKMNANQAQKWIWVGAFAGVVMSVIAASLINIIFSSAMAGTNREIIEGATGIIAVLMMIGVGIWLHQKSNIQAWNRYINNQMGKALSTGSILSMSFISFLSIFREGAETIIFYTGMAPSISTDKLLTGIGIAVLILAVFAIALIKFSSKIPIAPFFKLATILIYALAFKILGVSIHSLQLTNVISTNLIKDLPIIDMIGFFPTWETCLSQLMLLVIFVSTVVIFDNKNKNSVVIVNQ